VGLDAEYPSYDFKTHKGYVTDLHTAKLTEHGPCAIHRMRFVNVRRAAGLETLPDVQNGETGDAEPSVGRACRDQMDEEYP
jgi:ribonuclease HII